MFRFLSWFRRDRKPQSVQGQDTQPSQSIDTMTPSQFRTLVVETLYSNRNRQIEHEWVEAAARMIFNVDLPKALWKFREGSKADLKLFTINAVHPKFGQGQLLDLELSLAEISLNTSLTLTLSIRDLPELMVPFIPTPLYSDTAEP